MTLENDKLTITPINISEANHFVLARHRHHGPVVGAKFAIGVSDSSCAIRGVALVGRPVARLYDDGWTLEVNRLCTDGTPNACSMLYAAAWRAARAMGYRRLITYTLISEGGTSLRAAGWKVIGERRQRSWDMPSRPRIAAPPTGQKYLWEVTI
jgi:hypothetical protein